MEFLADTTFLIDLHRSSHTSAYEFLEKNPDSTFGISVITVGELVPGFVKRGQKALLSFISPFPVIMINEEIAWIYGELYVSLKEKGSLIATNDLWISACAIAKNIAVVTRNFKDFTKVPGLKVESY